MDYQQKEKFSELKLKARQLREYLEIDKKTKEISGLDELANKADFWEKPEAQDTVKKLGGLRSLINEWKVVEKKAGELETILQLSKEESDPALEKEFVDGIIILENKLSLIEVESKLSAPQDRMNAIVSLHAGAGGTEACDWADMLFRMYTRWAEKKRFSVEIVDSLPGDSAGLKSATFFIRGEYAHGQVFARIITLAARGKTCPVHRNIVPGGIIKFPFEPGKRAFQADG